MKITNLKLLSREALNWLLSLFAAERDNEGKRTVPIAIANIPKGNCINLSDIYSQVGLPVSSNEANIVSINKFICVTPPAKTAGTIHLKNLGISELLRFTLGTGSLSIAFKGANWIISCRTPARKTPHERDIKGVLILGAISNAKIIKVKLKIIGVAAGNENLEWVFWIPAANATKDISAKYGNIILNTFTARSCFSESK